ncbi:MAG: hypothetical protein EBX52_02740 [Proteobacteria bacterium]|nr:hypothetical protein [Pseudomonadota bacterium]
MGTLKKFSSQMDEQVFKQLKNLSTESKEEISSLLTEAVVDLIQKKSLRPAFRKAAEEAFVQFDEALSELAK